MYYVGLALMNRKELDSSLKYFYKCDEAGRFLDEDVSGFTVKVNLKIGNIYDIRGQRELAIQQYKKVLAWEERQNSHEEAKDICKILINNNFLLLENSVSELEQNAYLSWKAIAQKELKINLLIYLKK